MRYATFELAGQTFGIDVRDVREVIREQTLTPVPRSLPTIAGLINLRGQIVTAFDLRVRFAFPRRAEDRRSMNVVVATPAGPVALVVDRIGDVVDVGDAAPSPPPPTLPTVVRGAIAGAHPLDGDLLLVVDVTAALRSEAVAA